MAELSKDIDCQTIATFTIYNRLQAYAIYFSNLSGTTTIAQQLKKVINNKLSILD